MPCHRWQQPRRPPPLQWYQIHWPATAAWIRCTGSSAPVIFWRTAANKKQNITIKPSLAHAYCHWARHARLRVCAANGCRFLRHY